MKFSLFSAVAFLAVAAAAQGLDTREAEEFDVADMVDTMFEERDVAGTPAKCNGDAKQIPKCARPGITSCTKKAGCGARNYTCGCKHTKGITKCATPKVLKACSTAEAVKTQKAVKKLCKCAT